ncbi:MAG TPA: ribonuclease HII [Spirochaetota bacterium]|nr:ribonuclease HII [Spirochaetota bacterium]HPJ35461.1 ribonuclease HII [Spirochaetota bacterium]
MSPPFNLGKNRPDFSIEEGLFREGYRVVAGIDEAGRGALAGPLGIGLVIYSPEMFGCIPPAFSDTINDSKKITHKKRVRALADIEKNAVLALSLLVPHTVIDEININRATELGIRRLIEKSPVKPDVLIIDGNYRFKFSIPSVSVVKGDCRSLTIASASIVAKVKRDLIMDKIDSRYPGYGFSGNKGYGTAKHLASIEENGFTVVHRKSYDPVRSMIEAQGRLFDEDQ